MKKLFILLFLFSSVILAKDVKYSFKDESKSSNIENIILQNNLLNTIEGIKEEIPQCYKEFFIDNTYPKANICRKHSNSICGNEGVCYYSIGVECEVCFDPKNGFSCQNVGG